MQWSLRGRELDCNFGHKNKNTQLAVHRTYCTCCHTATGENDTSRNVCHASSAHSDCNSQPCKKIPIPIPAVKTASSLCVFFLPPFINLSSAFNAIITAPHKWEGFDQVALKNESMMTRMGILKSVAFLPLLVVGIFPWSPLLPHNSRTTEHPRRS